MRLSYAASGKIGLVSVHLRDSGNRASPPSPRRKRGMTFGVGQRSGNSSALNHCVHGRFHAGWCFAMGPRSMGKLRFAFSSVACGRRLLVARTRNEVVPTHKEILRARQTPVPLISIVCWVLACTVPGTRYAAPGTRGSRLKYVQRVLVLYNTTAAVRILYLEVVAHIPISLLNFEGVACRNLFTSSASTPKTWWEGSLLF